MYKKQTVRVNLILAAVVMIGVSLACNFPTEEKIKEAQRTHTDVEFISVFLDDWIAQTQRETLSEYTREDELQFYEQAEGHTNWSVDESGHEIPSDDLCDPNFTEAGSGPMGIDHEGGLYDSYYNDSILVTDSYGTRRYQRYHGGRMFCREVHYINYHPNDPGKDKPELECITFTTPYRYELTVYEVLLLKPKYASPREILVTCYYSVYTADIENVVAQQEDEGVTPASTEQDQSDQDDEPESLSIQEADAGHFLEISMEPINEWTYEDEYNCGSWWLITNTHPSMPIRAIYRLTYGWGPKGTVTEKWSFTTIRPGETDRLNFGLHTESDGGRRHVNDPFEYAAFIWDWDEETTAWIRDQFEDDYYLSGLTFYSFPHNPCGD